MKKAKKVNHQLELAKRLCEKEGLKKQVNIAQMCEILKCLKTEFCTEPNETLTRLGLEVYDFVYRTNDGVYVRFIPTEPFKARKK